MWAKVLRPHLQNKGKPGEKEVWSIDLLLSMHDPAADLFIKGLKEKFIAAHGKGSRPGPNGLPFKRFVDDEGNETELWQVAFKRNVRTRRGAELAPPVVQDAAGNPWPKDVLIGNGSTGRIAYDVWDWNSEEGGKGISLNLGGVRILHLVEYQTPSAADAFGEPEQGYVLTGDEARSTEAPGSAVVPADWDDSDEEVPF